MKLLNILSIIIFSPFIAVGYSVGMVVMLFNIGFEISTMGATKKKVLKDREKEVREFLQRGKND